MSSQSFDPENNDTHAFAKLLVHHYPHNRMVSGEEMNWAMQWLCRKSLKEEANRNNDDWVKDLRTLRLHGYDTHRLDRKRAIKYLPSFGHMKAKNLAFRSCLIGSSQNAAAEEAMV